MEVNRVTDSGVSLDDKKKRILVTIGTLFIAVMFIGSYAALGNNSATTISSTTTVSTASTYFVSGTVNGIVNGYSTLAVITLATNSSSSQVGNILAQLESNGSISNYVTQGNGYEVFTAAMNAYEMQQTLYRSLNSSSTVIVNTTTTATLPLNMVLYYRTQAVPIKLPSRNVSVAFTPLLAIGANVPLLIHALVYANGTVSNGGITVSHA